MIPKHISPHPTHKLLSVSQNQHPYPVGTHHTHTHTHAHAHPLPPSPQSHTHIDIEPIETPTEREYLVTPSHPHPHPHPHPHTTFPILPTSVSDFPQSSPASAVELANITPNLIHEFPDIEMHSNDKRKSSLQNGNGSTNNLNGQSSTPTPVRILCFNLATLPKPVVFLGLSAAMCFFFLANSYVEEYLFRELPKFKYGWYMTSFELFSFAGFAVIERLAGNDDTAQQSIWSHRASYDKHLLVALVMTLSRGLTNQSLQYLNYPTQVIFKSMKLITVMIGAVWVLQKKYNIYEYVAALLLVTSAILFSLGDSELTPNFHVLGIIIVLISLVFDAAHSTTQENLMNKHGASTLEAVMYTNAFAGALALLVVIVTGELIPALTFCWQHPQSYYLFCFRALFVYGGVLCFVVLIQTHGVVVATSVTTVRKILTILLSFYNFPKPWVAKYMYGLLTFAAAVILGAYNDTQNKKQKAAAAELEKKLQQTHHHINNIPHHSQQRGHEHQHEDVALLHRAHSIKST